MNNIILIGMPGAGKSTVGVILAKVLGYKFVDADLLIQEKEDRLLHEIIKAEGVDGFINIENQVNSSITAHKSVIATGGSVVYGKEAMKHLQKIGTIIYLKLSFDELNKRLTNINNRGVIMKDSQTLYDLYLERTPLYERYAEIIVETDGCSVEDSVRKITQKLDKK